MGGEADAEEVDAELEVVVVDALGRFRGSRGSGTDTESESVVDADTRRGTTGGDGGDDSDDSVSGGGSEGRDSD